MEERNVVPQLGVSGGKLVVTSLNIAEVFGKRHDNVLQAIKNLEVPETFRLLNFQAGSYLRPNPGGPDISTPMYNLTRDGFTLLVMGFTGKEAMKFKLAGDLECI